MREDLPVAGLLKHHWLAHAIGDEEFGVRQPVMLVTGRLFPCPAGGLALDRDLHAAKYVEHLLGSSVERRNAGGEGEHWLQPGAASPLPQGKQEPNAGESRAE